MDVVVRQARIGLELVDVLTGSAIVGASSVDVEGQDVKGFVIGGARWVFEDLAAGSTTFDVRADQYVPTSVTAVIPALGAIPDLLKVELLPRTGYPFPPGLTRVFGLVALDGQPVAGADVSITAKHVGTSSTTTDTAVSTATTDDGQFTMWFTPQLVSGDEPPVANFCDITVTVGVSSQTVNDVPLAPFATSPAPTFSFP